MKRSLISAASLTCLTLATAASSLTAAATQAFIEYEGVAGEPSDFQHDAWIDVAALSRATRPQRASVIARPAGDLASKDITIVKEVDKASPKLAEAVCGGKIFPKVEISLMASSDDAGRESPKAYELINARITKYKVDASKPDVRPTEEIVFTFTEVKAVHAPPGTAMRKGEGKLEPTWKVEKGE